MLIRNKQPKAARKGALLSLELVIALPVLALVVLAAVEFSFLLLGSQAITAAANVGARQAALPSTASGQVKDAVFQALGSWRWTHDDILQVLVFVDTQGDGDLDLVYDSMDPSKQDGSNELLLAPTGRLVQVTVKLPSNEAAPDLLSFVPGLSISGQELTASFVTRKE